MIFFDTYREGHISHRIAQNSEKFEISETGVR